MWFGSKRATFLVSAAVVATGQGFGCANKFYDCSSAHACGSGGTGAGGFAGTAGMTTALTAGLGGFSPAGIGGGIAAAGNDSSPAGMGTNIAGASGDDGVNHGDGAGAGGSTGEGGVSGEGGMSGESGVPDTTPPEIVSIVPEDGATGVRADAEIVVTFSEPMDESETEHAFESDELRPSAISFSWSDRGRVMTVHPKNGLEYGALAAPAPTYSFALTTLARDLAGNHLVEAQTVSFATLTQYTQSLTPVDVRQLTEDAATTQACTVTTLGGLVVGDTDANMGLGVLVTFDLGGVGTLPSPGDWQSATLSATVLLGLPSAISAFQVSIDPSLATWDTPLGADLGVLASPAGGGPPTYSVDVLSTVVGDSKNANSTANRSEYVLRWPDGSNLDDKAEQSSVQCAGITLDLTYLGT